jgi:pyridoxine 4-dehydrogenase
MHTAIPQAARGGRIELGGEVAVNQLGFGAMRITIAGILGEPRDPEEASPRVPIEESLGEISRLQAEGKVRMIGVSNVSVAQLERAQAVADVVSVQNRYSLGVRDSEQVLELCGRDGIAFLPSSPLGAGSLPSAPELEAMAAANGATAAQVAIAWLLQRSPVMWPIPGTSSVAHLEENVAAASLRLTEQEYERLSRRSP